jgi:hypothetical protein
MTVSPAQRGQSDFRGGDASFQADIILFYCATCRPEKDSPRSRGEHEGAATMAIEKEPRMNTDKHG